MVESWTDTLRRHWPAAHWNSYARSSDKATICSLNPDLIVEKKKHGFEEVRRSGINVRIQRAERHMVAVGGKFVDECMDF